MNSSDKLWKLKQLEHKRHNIEIEISVLKDNSKSVEKFIEINKQISELLEDE